MRERAQTSLSVVEAVVGLLLILGVAVGFGLGTAAPVDDTAELDAMARDTAAVLGSEPTAGGETTQLVALARSATSFDRVRGLVRERVDRLLPPDVLYRIETPHGNLGHPRPRGTPVGSTRVPTRHGPVEIRVWYG